MDSVWLTLTVSAWSLSTVSAFHNPILPDPLLLQQKILPATSTVNLSVGTASALATSLPVMESPTVKINRMKRCNTVVRNKDLCLQLRVSEKFPSVVWIPAGIMCTYVTCVYQRQMVTNIFMHTGVSRQQELPEGFQALLQPTMCGQQLFLWRGRWLWG